MLSISEAKQRVLSALPLMSGEHVAISESGGRIAVAAIAAARTLPPNDNSAMDGFAVRSDDLPGVIPVDGTIAAGDPADRELKPGTVLRIMTGAPMPSGADAVVMRENVTDHGDRAEFAQPAVIGRHIRRAGEDVAVGDVIVHQGTALDAGLVGLLAAQGHPTVAVAKRPTIAILSTGNELVEVGTVPGSGQIVNSNAHALAAQVREAGGNPLHLGIALDTLDDLIPKLRRGLDADVLLTCGGVSVGDYDFVKEAFDDIGVNVDFWKVSIKPGKPLVYGHAKDGTPVFGLPGNPVSSMVTFEIFVRPSILAMQHASRVERPQVQVTLADRIGKKPGRTHYVRVRLSRSGDELIAHAHSKQGSGMLSSMIGIDALVVIPRDEGDQPAGSRANALLLRAV